VVRVVVPERGAMAYGSGALVAARGQHGLVLTNWHVVRGATGPIHVHFPDGFYSRAVVLRADRDWDLAALRIARPRVRPIALANRAPQPGEPLTIAGYGSGQYRVATGRCTQYVSPGTNLPFEMVEIAAGARQGDSGGPILNRRGELAGVLFGSALGRTTGSYCGRVRRFLDTLPPDALPEVPPQTPTMIAQRNAKSPSPHSGPGSEPARGPAAKPTSPPAGTGSVSVPGAPLVAGATPHSGRGQSSRSGHADPKPGRRSAVVGDLAEFDLPQAGPAYPHDAAAEQRRTHPGHTAPRSPSQDGWVAASEAPQSPALAQVPGRGSDQPVAEVGPSTFDQVKTVLAAVGLFALLFHGLRALSIADAA
jgi:hypothetical protein